jgi:hypothetical protein
MFAYFIFLVAFLMEGLGSYISVVGLNSVFKDWVTFALVVILDVAKVTVVTLLHNQWKKSNLFIKGYLMAALVVLMTITSYGAFSYLGSDFQKAISPNETVTLQINQLEAEKTTLVSEKANLDAENQKLSDQVAALPSNLVRGRKTLIDTQKPEHDRITDRLDKVTKRLDEIETAETPLKTQSLQVGVEAGPITYISKTFGISAESASTAIILVIIFVFDPLAIMLVLQGNILMAQRREEKKTQPPVDIPPPVKEDDIAPVENGNWPPYRFSPELETTELALDPFEPPTDMVPGSMVEYPPVVVNLPNVEPVRLVTTLLPVIGETNPAPDASVPSVPTPSTSFTINAARDVIPEGYVGTVIDRTKGDNAMIYEHAVLPTPPEPEAEVLAPLTVHELPTDENTEYAHSELEDLQILLPQALFREGATTTSSKRPLYE